MIFFHHSKIRRFHHEFIYYDERKERLEKMQKDVKAKKENQKIGKHLEVGRNKEYGFNFSTSQTKKQNTNFRLMLIVGITTMLTILAVYLLTCFM